MLIQMNTFYLLINVMIMNDKNLIMACQTFLYYLPH